MSAVVVLLLGAGLGLAPGASALPSPTSKRFSYTDYITVNTTNVVATLHRSNPDYALMDADNSGYTVGLLYGVGFTITSIRSSAWELRYTVGTQGVGFYESSGGIIPGTTAKIHTYVNPVKPDGIYTGNVVLRYDTRRWGWLNGPVIHYQITLTA